MTVLEERLGAWANFEPTGRQGKATDAFDILTLNIPGLLEMCCDVMGICFLPTLNGAGGSQNQSRIAKNVPIQPGINDSRVAQVKVNESARLSHDDKQQIGRAH